MASVVTTQFCHCGMKAATDSVRLSGPGWVLLTHSFPNQAPGPAGGRWLALLQGVILVVVKKQSS